MFLPVFVCLSICLSVSKITQNGAVQRAVALLSSRSTADNDVRSPLQQIHVWKLFLAAVNNLPTGFQSSHEYVL